MVIRIPVGHAEIEQDEPVAPPPQEPKPQEPQGNPYLARMLSERESRAAVPTPVPTPAAQTVPQEPVPSGQNPYLERMLAERESGAAQREDRFLSTFRRATQANPELVAEARRIAEQLGIAPDLAEGNIDVARQVAKEQAVRYQRLRAESPVLLDTLSNGDFARIAHDDIDNLATTESLFGWVGRHVETGEITNERGYLGTRAALGWATQDEADRLAEIDLQLAESGQESGFIPATLNILGQVKQTVPLAIGAGAAAAAPSFIAGPGAPVAAGTAFTIGSTAAVFGSSAVVEGGNKYLDLIARGVPHEQALGPAFGHAIVAGGLEAFAGNIVAAPFKKAAANLAARAAGKALTRPEMSRAWFNLVKGYAKSWGGEVGTEMAQDVSGFVADQEALRAAGKPTDGLGQLGRQMGETFQQVGMGMSLLSLPGPVMHFVSESGAARRATAQVNWFKALNKGAAESKVRERDPKAYAGAVGAMAEASGTPNLYIDGKAFLEVLNQTDKADVEAGHIGKTTAEQLNEVMPEVMQRAAEAVARGEDVVIPTGDFAAHIAGKPLADALIPHLRADSDPESKSLAEAEIFRQEEKERAAEAAQILQRSETTNRAFVDSAHQVEDNLRQQLIATGMRYDEARDNAKLYRDIVVVKAKQNGQLPMEFVAQRPLRVVLGEPDQAGGTVAQDEPGGTPSPLDGQLGTSITTPEAAWEFAREHGNGEAGAILLDHQLRPMAFVPIDPAHAEKLRADDRMDSLYRAVSVSNAVQVVLVNNGKLSDAAVTNLGRLFGGMEILPREVVDTSKTAADSWGPRGKHIDSRDTFQSINRGAYRPSDFTIFLRKKANASTFLHELGHYYLHILGDLATQKVHPSIVDDMNHLLQWFGIKDVATWNAMTMKQQEKYHEQFARSFETWLWQGKAPSAAMEGLFHRFARLLRAVYGTIVGEINAKYRDQFGEDLPVLTPEVRGVMERMVASEEEIAHAEVVNRMTSVFQTQEQSGMDDAAWAAYQELAREATDEAIAEHTQDRLRQVQWLRNAESKVVKDLQNKRAAERAKMRLEVAERVEREPVYRARAWIERGEFVDQDGTKGVQAGGSHKLQVDAVLSLLPEGRDPPKGLTGKNGIASQDGLLPDTAAKVFGFDTGSELVNALLSAPPLDAAIEAATDEAMLTYRSELADPKEFEASVLRALHNKSRGRFIAVEYRAMTKAMQPLRVLLQSAADLTRRVIGKQEVWRISARDHAIAEARATRAVGEALRKGDTAAAIEAQRKRMLQHEMAKEAGRAMEEIAEALQDIGRFDGANETLAKTRDMDLVYAGRRLGAAYGILPKFESEQQRDIARRAVEAVKQAHPVIGNRLSTLLEDAGDGVRNYRDLPLATFRELREVAESLWNEAGRAKVIEVQGKRVQIATIAGEVAARIVALPERSAPGSTAAGDRTPSAMSRLVLKGWNAVANLKRARHWAHFMDGGERGPFFEYLIAPLQRATDTYRKVRDKVIAKYHARLLDVAKKAGARWDAEIAAPELLVEEGGKLVPYKFRGKKELIHAVMHAGSQSNLEKLLVPYGWAAAPETTGDILDTRAWDRFLARMFKEGILTPTDIEFVQFVWGTYAELLPEGQKTHKKVYGFEFKTIEHRQLHTPWGTVEGGYVPAFTDRDVAPQRLSQTINELADEEHAFVYSVSAGRGHTMQRNPFYRQRLALGLASQAMHLDAQLRFTYLQPAIKDALRIVRHRDFSTPLNAYDREAINTIIVPMIENVALQATSRVGDIALMDKAAGFARRGASLAAFGLKFMTAAVQLTGITASMHEVRGRYLRSGLAVFGKAPINSVRAIAAQSEVMRQRFDTRAGRIIEEITRVSETRLRGLEAPLRAVTAGKQELAHWAFTPLRLVQNMVDAVTWIGAHQQAVVEAAADGSLTEDQVQQMAVEHADDVVKRTQGSKYPEDLAAYESGTPVQKLWTQFGGFSNVLLNQVLGANQGWGPKLRASLYVLLLPTLFEATLRMLAQGTPDDDDGDGKLDDIAVQYGRSALRNAAGLIPGVGPFALSIAESEGNRVAATPAGMFLGSAAKGLFSAFDERDMSGQDARNLGVLLTIVTGLPLAPIANAYGYDVDVGRGKAKPSGTADYLRGLVVGR